MSTSPLRAAMVPVTRRVRAYFAPVNRATETPVLFDPGKSGRFVLDAPPAPWVDLGWIDKFQRLSGTVTEPLRAGTRGAAVGQWRGPLEARVEFDFREWGKLQMALAGGSEHMNVLASDPNANAQPSGGTALAAVAVLSGSTANQVVVGAGAVNAFSVGDVIAVDADYQQQTGYVGTGIAAAYVTDPALVNRDANYVRRVTFNLGRVVQTTATTLLLAQPLLGGAPAAAMGVQKVIAFVDREGGSFFQEWSGLFIAEEESGGRVCFHYPRLSWTAPGRGVSSSAPSAVGSAKSGSSGTGSAKSASSAKPQFAGNGSEELAQIAPPIACVALRAAFLALPHTDENDGQTVLCYRSYFPAAQAALY